LGGEGVEREVFRGARTVSAGSFQRTAGVADEGEVDREGEVDGEVEGEGDFDGEDDGEGDVEGDFDGDFDGEGDVEDEGEGEDGDPRAIGRRGKALVERLARGGEEGPPMRLAPGVPLRQALLAILADAARDPEKKAILEAELGGKSVEEATDEELRRAVSRIRGG
jgi:hypothetical protein